MKDIIDSLGPKGTRIVFIDDATGEVTHVEHNQQTIAGSQYTAMLQFGLPEKVKFPNYNTDLGIDPNDRGTYDNDICCLWMAGNGGCGTKQDDVYPVNFADRIHPEDVVPFQYRPKDDDLSEAMREIYFGRKENPKTGRIAYYYKRFKTKPSLSLKRIDGTDISSDVYKYSKAVRATCYVEIGLNITTSDFRDFYLIEPTAGGIGNARINQISLLTGHFEVSNGVTVVKNVRPLTQTNFSNDWFSDLTKSCSIKYQVFY